MRKIILILITLFFIGCSSTIGKIFHKDEKFITLTQYTKRGQIIKSFETIAFINVTYLNPILKEKEKNNNEIFIIGIYNDNDIRGDKKGGIFNPNYSLTMNNLNPIKIEIIDKKKFNIANYPFYQKWMKYYKVYFPKVDNSKLKITYKNNRENSQIMLTIDKNLNEE